MDKYISKEIIYNLNLNLIDHVRILEEFKGERYFMNKPIRRYKNENKRRIGEHDYGSLWDW